MSIYTKAKQKGNKGEALIESLLSENSVVHKVDGSKDIGLDMICEWINDEKPTSLLFGVQVKTENIKLKLKNKTSKLNLLEEYEGSVSIKKKTLDYWKTLGFPVFVFLVNLNDGMIYYKRYTSIVHGQEDHTKEPFYLAVNDGKFLAYVKSKRTCGFCRDLFLDHLRCQHIKGELTGIDPNLLGLDGWKQDALYAGVFDQYISQIRANYEKYKKWSKFFYPRNEKIDNEVKSVDNMLPVHEGLIVSSLYNCFDLINLISKNPIKKEIHYLIEHLILSIRELNFYINDYYKDKEKLTEDDNQLIKNVIDIRDAICHRSSQLNFLNPNLLISGNLIFKNNDVEIQYGKTKILLLNGLIKLYIKFRNIIANGKDTPYWNIESRKLDELLTKLSKKLSTKNVSKKLSNSFGK